MKFYVGTDVGGTFTDIWVSDGAGRARVFKATTTQDVIGGVLGGVRLAAEAHDLAVDAFCASIARFGHGTTIGLNALLTGSAARTGLIATRGFADTLAIGRMRRQTSGLSGAEVADLKRRGRYAPIVPRALIAEVTERVDCEGRIVVPLDEAEADAALRHLADAGVEALAVCTLWSVRNPAHEQRLGAMARAILPGAFVTLSHEIAPAVGEYARMSTTAVNAALGPVAGRYLARLEAELARLGMRVPVLMMTSAGSVLPTALLTERPATVLFSGPAAGVIGSAATGVQLGLGDVLTCDVGGTSFDAGLVVAGRPVLRPEIAVAGADLRVPSVDVASIGAGGGSVARVVRGALEVGPRSAGAVPGPACYGRGGTEPTATDADLVLGVLNPDGFLGGRMRLDKDAAEQAIERHVARPLGLSVVEAAWGIREVLGNKMADLLRRVTIERGYDPAGCTLVANGGAGPSHAWALARSLGLPGFVVPATATGQSAFGTGTSDVGTSAERPAHLRLGGGPAEPSGADLERVTRALDEAEREASATVAAAGEGGAAITRTLAMRYKGQTHALDVELAAAGAFDLAAWRAAVAAFGRRYEAAFGRGAGSGAAGYETLSVRVTAVARAQTPAPAEEGDALTPVGTRAVVFDDPAAPVQATIYRAHWPRAGEAADGPCVIEYPGQSVVVPPGARARADVAGNLVVRLAAEAPATAAPRDILEHVPTGREHSVESGARDNNKLERRPTPGGEENVPTPSGGLDAVRFEIVRNRLVAITEEMRVALQSVSGSPTVTEASDFFTGLFTPEGAFASMGFQVSFQAPVLGTLIRHMRAKPGLAVRDGDMFLGNDPYIGALHQNDVQMVGPIYAGEELIAWAGVEAHEVDVGGMDFASWSPKARDVRQEGMRVPCVKLVDRGELREDVLEMFLAGSRLPGQLGLDVRAFIATLNVARARIAELVERYGASALHTAMGRMIESSEAQVRARLAELPDAEIRVQDFLEHDGHANTLYRVDLRLQKQGDGLTLDFSGSSSQAPGFVNCTRAGLVGGVAGAMLPMLAHDVQWNEGVLRAAEIVAPDGLICTARFPAPVGAATVEAIWVVSNAVSQALNKLLALSPATRGRAQAVSDGTMATFNLGGVNQYGEPFGMHLMDPLAGGSGAFADQDGVDAGGPINSPMPSIADVERNETAVPLFYLYRRLAADTGGAGRRRGGVGAEVALTLGGISQAEALVMTHGAEVPNSAGLFGGWPGATVRQAFRRGAWDAPEEAFGPKPGLMTMTSRDVFTVSWQGGGGVGDPIEREPDLVLGDVLAGLVSALAAAALYGVVVEEGRVALPATEAKRAAIRRARLALGRAPTRRAAGILVPLQGALCLARDADGVHIASAAGFVLATGHTRWRAGAVAERFERAPGGTGITLHAGLCITAHYCPGSGALLAVDVHERDQPPLDDLLIEPGVLESLAQGSAALAEILP